MTSNTGNSNENLPSIQADEFLPPLGHWTVIGGLVIVGIVVIAIPVASLAKFKTTVKGQATVRPAGEVRLVQAAAEGPVMEISVKRNQSVEKGDIIATIDDSPLDTKKSQLQSGIQQARLQLGQINAQVSAQRMLALTEAEEAKADLSSTEAAFRAAKSKHKRYKPIAEIGALSQNDLEEAQLAAEQQAQAVEAAQARVKRVKAGFDKEQETLLQQQIEISQQLEQYTYELQQVKTDLRQTTITATAAGIISELNLRNPGQTVRAGEEIAQIVPRDAPLQVKAAVAPDEIDKVKVRQPVQMRVSACPYPDYGVLQGDVHQISKDTIKPKASGTTAETSGPANQNGDTAPAFYEVMIEPKSQTLGQGDHQCSLQLGMEGNVDIVTREETVLKFLLRKARLITNS